MQFVRTQFKCSFGRRSEITWKTKLKITGPSGSSLHFDGELTTEQTKIIVSVLHGLPDMAESKSYSKMLYAIADECRAGDANNPVRVSPEALDEAAERIDTQTVMIRGLELQRSEIIKLIKRDDFATSFQSMGQYRTALIACMEGIAT